MIEASEVEASRAARQALDRGDLFSAYESITKALEAGASSHEIRYLEVLTLARMGDVQEAMRRYREHDLSKVDDADVLAVRARLLKDHAFESQDGDRGEQLFAAARAYCEVHARKGGYFPLINAATLALLAGRTDLSSDWAREVLRDPAVAQPDSYWAAATKAEAMLVLGMTDEAAVELRKAAAMPDATLGARSSTLRQLERLLRQVHRAADRVEEMLGILRPGPVAHFCGHIFKTNGGAEAELADRIDAVLALNGISIAYGALASGADIIFAERLLEKGGELHLILPFDQEDFLLHSVMPAGVAWKGRFDRCFEAAASRTFASKMNYVGDDQQYAFGSRMAMGMARLRAGQICSGSVQVAIWDGVRGVAAAGTAADVALWESMGGTSIVIPPGRIDRVFERPPRPPKSHPRAVHAVVFTDFPGFSTLSEIALPHFWREVMDRSAALLEKYRSAILCQNTWGDAIYLIVDDPATAAEIALELRDALQQADFGAMGLSEPGNMRVAVHYGPIYRTFDRILGRINYFGTEVSRAARVEPVTPPGSIYVTEPFAAIMETQNARRFRLGYVGLLNLAKNYGSFRIYRLSRR